jgi:hypothetical protein
MFWVSCELTRYGRHWTRPPCFGECGGREGAYLEDGYTRKPKPSSGLEGEFGYYEVGFGQTKKGLSASTNGSERGEIVERLT